MKGKGGHLNKITPLLLALFMLTPILVLVSPLPTASAPPPVDFLSSIPTNNGEPIRIATDELGLLYVAVPYASKILKFSPDGQQAGAITLSRSPLSVAVDANRIYVGYFQGGSVQAMTPGGDFLFSFGNGGGEFGTPGDMAVGANRRIYITDSPNHIVKVYGDDGTFAFQFGGLGNGAGQMNFPTGIAVDDDYGEVYVVDNSNGRVEVFGLEGNFIRTFGSRGDGPSELSSPQGIYVEEGKVFVADAFQSRIQVYDRNGSFLGSIGHFGSELEGLKNPMDVAVSDGRLYISNSYKERIDIYGNYVNGLETSGLIGIQDAVAALQIMAGLPAIFRSAADVNNDGIIGFADAIYALQCAAGLRQCQ